MFAEILIVGKNVFQNYTVPQGITYGCVPLVLVSGSCVAAAVLGLVCKTSPYA